MGALSPRDTHTVHTQNTQGGWSMFVCLCLPMCLTTVPLWCLSGVCAMTTAPPLLLPADKDSHHLFVRRLEGLLRVFSSDPPGLCFLLEELAEMAESRYPPIYIEGWMYGWIDGWMDGWMAHTDRLW